MSSPTSPRGTCHRAWALAPHELAHASRRGVSSAILSSTHGSSSIAKRTPDGRLIPGPSSGPITGRQPPQDVHQRLHPVPGGNRQQARASRSTVTTAQGIRAPLSSRSFVESFSTNVRRFPGTPALVWRGEPVSYRELNDRALRARAELSEAGIGAAPIGVRCVKSPDSIAVILACLMDQRPFLLPATTLPEHALQELFLRLRRRKN